MDVHRVDELMAEARRLAAEYHRTTGKPLAVSGENAVCDAIARLGLEPARDGADDYDAERHDPSARVRLQTRARLVVDDATRRPHRPGQLEAEKSWDAVLLVLMDEDYAALQMHEASRGEIEQAPAEAAPNKRGRLCVARFRNIGRLAWTREDGCVIDG